MVQQTMLVIAVIAIFTSIIMIGMSLWQYSKIIITFLLLGPFSLSYHEYQRQEYFDFLFIFLEIIGLEITYYFVMSHKIMNKKSTETIHPSNLLNYLKENNAYNGYRKLTYQTTNLIILTTLVAIIIHLVEEQ